MGPINAIRKRRKLFGLSSGTLCLRLHVKIIRLIMLVPQDLFPSPAKTIVPRKCVTAIYTYKTKVIAYKYDFKLDCC